MKILVAGDRNWDDVKTIVDALEQFPSGTILIHGACAGVDNTCAAVAEALGFTVKAYPADWIARGRAAGPIRNQQMINEEHNVDEPIDICLAFHNDVTNSRGTRDMIKRAEKEKIIVRLIMSPSVE